MLAELNAKFFEHVADGDQELEALIKERGQVDDEPAQDGGAVQVAQADGLMAQVQEAAADAQEEQKTQ